MVLTGTERGSDGTSSFLRGTWYEEGTSVRKIAERSRDGDRARTLVTVARAVADGALCLAPGGDPSVTRQPGSAAGCRPVAVT
jgi:hypothetical protein